MESWLAWAHSPCDSSKRALGAESFSGASRCEGPRQAGAGGAGGAGAGIAGVAGAGRFRQALVPGVCSWPSIRSQPPSRAKTVWPSQLNQMSKSSHILLIWLGTLAGTMF